MELETLLRLSIYVAAHPCEWLEAYRLLQLALIWVFTLRNGLQVPTAAAREWATQTDEIVHGIKACSKLQHCEQKKTHLLLGSGKLLLPLSLFLNSASRLLQLGRF
eukprot:5265968-Amphidinium_carterae.1